MKSLARNLEPVDPNKPCASNVRPMFGQKGSHSLRAVQLLFGGGSHFLGRFFTGNEQRHIYFRIKILVSRKNDLCWMRSLRNEAANILVVFLVDFFCWKKKTSLLKLPGSLGKRANGRTDFRGCNALCRLAVAGVWLDQSLLFPHGHGEIIFGLETQTRFLLYSSILITLDPPAKFVLVALCLAANFSSLSHVSASFHLIKSTSWDFGDVPWCS